MKVWDMHCDTLSVLRRARNEGTPLSFRSNDLHMSLEGMQQGDYLLQCFACFVYMKEEKEPLTACLEMVDEFYRLLAEYPDELMQVKSSEDIQRLPGSGKIGAMLTLEEGAVCLDDVRQLRNLYRLGARMMTLTWNFKNGLASPNRLFHDPADPRICEPVEDEGLTDKGVEMLAEMERLHMILDVSHLSDGGFWSVAEHAKRPFVASHSNARACCGHVRNLTDDMIRTMGERGGLIGLNYYSDFLDPGMGRPKVVSRVEDMVRHAQHILNIGGEDILALGSDFDGMSGEMEITGAKDMPKLAQGLIQAGFSDDLIEKIYYKNAMRFFSENL